jgi:hypothetical protein
MLTRAGARGERVHRIAGRIEYTPALEKVGELLLVLLR